MTPYSLKNLHATDSDNMYLYCIKHAWANVKNGYSGKKLLQYSYTYIVYSNVWFIGTYLT